MLEKSDPIIPGWSRDRLASEHLTHPMFYSAGSLRELAFKAGINPSALAQNVADYNQQLSAGAPDRFGRAYRPHALSTPPFYGISMQGWTLVSFAGLSVNGNLQVLDSQRRAVPNLFAIGEVIGAGATSGAAYTNGMLVTPAITFGRLLGSQLARV